MSTLRLSVPVVVALLSSIASVVAGCSSNAEPSVALGNSPGDAGSPPPGSDASGGSGDAGAGGTKGALVASFGKRGIYEGIGKEILHIAGRPDGSIVYCEATFAWRVPSNGQADISSDTYYSFTHDGFTSCLALRATTGGASAIFAGAGGNGLVTLVDDPVDPTAFDYAKSTMALLDGIGGAGMFEADGSPILATTHQNAFGNSTACKYTASGESGNLYNTEACAAMTQANNHSTVSGVVARKDAILVAADVSGPGIIEVPFSNGTTKAATGRDALTGLGVTALGVSVLDSSERMVILGHKGTLPNADLVVVRLGKDLLPDTTFGSGGLATLGRSDISKIGEILLGPDGKIVVSATAGSNDSASRALVARFERDGKLDTSFGKGGVIQPLGETPSTGAAVTLTSDGNLMVGGAKTTAGVFLAKLTY